ENTIRPIVLYGSSDSHLFSIQCPALARYLVCSDVFNAKFRKDYPCDLKRDTSGSEFCTVILK
ncbi:hypothetical protein chiPu_0022156, partial [Chiloscyllium punctatum]|nr:hypothetical protein [Chiloscyllium punctatum]